MGSIFDLSKYKWSGLSSLQEGSSAHSRHQELVVAFDWHRLSTYASSLQGGQKCVVEEPVAIGGRHIVRILTFANGVRWIARLRKPASSASHEQADLSDSLMLREVDCLRLILARTSVPVPRVMGYAKSDAGFGAALILMECLPGNVGMDLHFDFVPREFQAHFFKQMANAQVQTCGMLFPRIGTAILLPDGSVDIGPIPGIGGPFETASAFFRSWAASVKFPLSMERVKECCGSLGDEVWQSTVSFPGRILELADRISEHRDRGPFPLVHVDYGHNNIVVDSEYNMLGVIDWEHALVAPWETVEFPLTVRATPRPMDVPDNYDADGAPKDERLRAKYKEREEYVQAVRMAEAELDTSSTLSDVLGDEKTQNLATAMRLFAVDGKMGYYSRVLDAYETGLTS